MRIKLSLAAAMLIFWTACGGSIAEKTNKALGTAIVATNAARDQFTEWDKGHQLAIVDKATTREQAESGLKEYRQKRQKIVQAFTVAYTSMASAAAMVPLVHAGTKKDRDLIELLVASVEAVQSVVSSVKEIREAFETAPAAPLVSPEPAPAPVPAEAGAGG